jgi:hypothetical protein
VCDALAKKASTSRVPSISIIDSEYAHFQEKWLDIISKFVKYFVHCFAIS